MKEHKQQSRDRSTSTPSNAPAASHVGDLSGTLEVLAQLLHFLELLDAVHRGGSIVRPRDVRLRHGARGLPVVHERKRLEATQEWYTARVRMLRRESQSIQYGGERESNCVRRIFVTSGNTVQEINK